MQRQFQIFAEGFDACRQANAPLVGWLQTYGQMWEKYRFFPSGRLEHWLDGQWRLLTEKAKSA